MKTKKKMSMYKKGGKTNPSKRKAPALSPTGRLLDDPRPQEKEFDPYNDPYFLRKDYVESGRKSAIAADAESPYEKKYRSRSRGIDMTADDVQERVNELVRSGEFSKETGAKAKKAIENFRADKDKMMRESGYGRTPEEKKAQDRAIRRMKNKKAKGGMKMPEYMAGGKVYKDGGSLLAALMKDPKQRAAAKKMLGM